MISFWVAGIPQPKGSGQHRMLPLRCPCGRVHRGGRVGRLGPFVESADMKTKTKGSHRLEKWTTIIRAAALAEGVKAMDGPVALDLEFCFERPRSHYTKTGRLTKSAPPRPATKPDADKLARAVKDALEAIAYANDSQVVDLRVRKRYASHFGVQIEIMPAAESPQVSLFEAAR